MKKRYYSLFAAAALLLATSCSQEEDFGQPSNVGLTTFSVSLDGTAGSRTAGDGQTVDKLYYAVYDGETSQVLYPTSGNYGTAEKVNGGWTLELPLMKSETYDILFWAQKDGSNAYTINNLKEITVNYDGVLSNKEDRDAFFNALDNFKASGSEHTVVLRRPFAQLNIATTIKDWEDAKAVTKTDKPVTASAVKVSSLATDFNVLTGAATATTPVTVEFKANELIDETISIKRAGEENPSEYKLLAMNYLLPVVTKAPNGVGNYQESTLDTDKDVVEVEFTLYKGENGAEQIVNVKVPSTPVQRNYRTNIIGDLLTGEVFDIIIDEDFDGEENQEIEITADGIVKEDGIYHITKPIGLYEFAKLVNYGSGSPLGRAATTGYSFKGETFVLDCDVDIEGEEWTPMDGFAGTFDGNGKTISNFKVNKAESAGLFGNLGKGATIKNLTVTDATILSNHWAGAIAGKGMCLKIENCKVENSTVTISAEKIGENWDNGDKAGAIIGYMSEAEAHITGCEANNVTIQAYRDLGGIVGYAHGTTISGNKVNDIVLTIDNTNNYKGYTTQDEHDAGDIVGEAATNSTVAGDNTATEGTVTIIYTAAAEYPGYYEDAEGNYCVTEEKGIETVLKDDDFWADKTDVSVILKSDLTVDVTAWDGDQNPQVFGNANTETITIDLQGNTLTFEQLNSDWNNIAANNAKLIIKNGHITSSGYNNGPWNRHDLNFACEVELIDITTDKAIALKNAGTLTNVTISDANTSDTYALWIQPKGQTVTLDGCTIDMLDCTDGRGIKIDNQYVVGAENGEAKVTLNVSNTTFKTEEKSAILVKTTVGADINLNNIDITGVNADNVCAVWVDGDAAASFDLVTVNGGKKALEDAGYYVDENGKYYATNSNGLAAIIAKNVTEINLTEGTFGIPSEIAGKTITFNGMGDGTVFDFTKAYNVGDATITFKNLYIEGKNANVMNGYGIQHTTKTIKYENCTLNNAITNENGGDVEYIGCTFTGTYYIATYAVKSAKFTNCIFDREDSRAVLVYSHGDNPCVVTLEGCTFKAKAKGFTGAGAWTAAVEIDTTNIPSEGTTVTITNCTVDENYSGIVRDKSAAGKANAVIVVDGLTYVSEGVWKDANGNYVVSNGAELNATIKVAEANSTIKLLAGTYEGVEMAGKIASGLTIQGTEDAIVKGIKCNLKSFTTGSELEGMTFKNVSFKEKGIYFVDVAGSPWGFVKNFTMTECTMTGSGTTVTEGNRLFDMGSDSPGSNQFINIKIEKCTISNVGQGIRLGGLTGENNLIQDNTISNIGHNAITLRSVAANSKVQVLNNTISNGNDRAFRIGTNSGEVIYKDNKITNTGDQEDGSNFKANTQGSVTFEGNTVDGASWNPLI